MTVEGELSQVVRGLVDLPSNQRVNLKNQSHLHAELEIIAVAADVLWCDPQPDIVVAREDALDKDESEERPLKAR